MNGNLNFNVIPNGQQSIQTVSYGQPQVQSNVQYVCGTGYPLQNTVQGMEFGVPNLQQLVPGASQTYACINQNGVTYLAVTPNIQHQPTPQCYQAIETPQGLQLFQVINNPVNFGQLCIQNIPETQHFLPHYPSYPQQTIANAEPISSTNFNSFSCQSALLKPAQDDLVNQQESLVTNVDEELNSDEDNHNEEDTDELLEEQNCSEGNQEAESSPNLPPNQDPLMALTSLTSSISSCVDNNTPNSNLFDMYSKNIPCNTSGSNIPIPPLGTLGVQQVLNLPDQQFPPNTRAFQVLVPTPQGMAIQTVVASYPDSYSPIVNNESIVGSNHFMNVGDSLNPELITQPVTQQLLNPIGSSETCKETPTTNQTTQPDNNTNVVIQAVSAPPVLQQVKRVTSPCHSTTVNNSHCSESESPASPQTIPKMPSSVPAPLPSPHCLPDSTEDLSQPTIKQSTSNVVDGIDLEDIREFARTFKMRRLVLGLTQTQVGQALCATEGPAYSQSAICRFEKLDITPRSALKIRPVLENWLREAEEKHQQGNLLQIAGMDYVNISAIGKIRKRRTFFSPEALTVLNSRFEQSSHPSGREISNIAQQIGYERDVVRVWFCNKRQSLRHCQTLQRSCANIKSSSDSGKPDNGTPSPTPQ